MNIYNTAGAAAKRSKDFPTAIENFSKVLEMDPANGAAAFQLGDCYYRSKNFTEAEKYFLVAKENGQEKNAVPRLANIALMQAKAAIKGKKYQEAYDFANASLGYDAPAARAVISPVLSSTLATDGFEEDHFTSLYVGCTPSTSDVNTGLRFKVIPTEVS